jgi:hypothetical protein
MEAAFVSHSIDHIPDRVLGFEIIVQFSQEGGSIWTRTNLEESGAIR